MTSLLGARKRAEEFAAAIDPSDERSTTASPELVELVELVGTLRVHEQPVLRPDFSTTLRAQLVAEAERTLAQDASLALRPRRRGTRERRLALLASSVVLVGGSAGMAVAAQGSLPGDALYPIKRGLEKAQTEVSRNDTSKGHDLLAQADHRLAEVQGIVGTDAETRVADTIEDFNAQATAGSDLLLGSFEETQDAQLVTDVRTFARDALSTLQTVAASADAESQDDLADAAAVLLDIDASATGACPECAEGEPALQLPQPFLAAEEANRALDRAADAGRRTQLDNNHPPLPGSSGSTPDGRSKDADKGGSDAPSTDGQTDQGGTTDEDAGSDDGGLLPDLGGTGDKGDGDKGDGGKKTRDKGLLGTVDDATTQLFPEGLDPLLDSLLP